MVPVIERNRYSYNEVYKNSIIYSWMCKYQQNQSTNWLRNSDVSQVNERTLDIKDNNYIGGLKKY